MRIDLAGWTREATTGDPTAFFALFEHADRLGYDAAWFSEFRLPRAPWPYPSPLLLAAALLARTERLRIGTSVLVLPLHHPLLLAEEIAQLNFQGNGRLDIGLGRGTDPTSLHSLGIDPQSTRERFVQGAQLLRAALLGQAVDGRGSVWDFPDCAPGVVAACQPPVPLYVAASTPESIAWAVQEDLPLLLSLEPPEGVQLERLDAAVRLQGRDASALRERSSLARYVCIGASAQAVREQLDALWPQLYARRVFFAAKRGVAAADVVPIDAPRVLAEQFIWGTPEQCHEQLLELQRRTGIQALRCIFNANGLWSNDQALQGMELFAREVMPALRQQATNARLSAPAP